MLLWYYLNFVISHIEISPLPPQPKSLFLFHPFLFLLSYFTFADEIGVFGNEISFEFRNQLLRATQCT